MQTTGFGKDRAFLSMYTNDKSRSDIPDYDFFAFPARGITPIRLFRKEIHAWSVSLNRQKYQVPDTAAITVNVYPARLDVRRAKLTTKNTPLMLEHVHVNEIGNSMPPAIIFRPTVKIAKPGTSFWAEITGVKNHDGSDAKISYYVGFGK